MHTPNTYTTPFQVPCSLSDYLSSHFSEQSGRGLCAQTIACSGETEHMRALLGDLRSVCLGIGSGTPVSNLTPQKTIPNFANRVTGSDATQHNTTHRKENLISIQ